MNKNIILTLLGVILLSNVHCSDSLNNKQSNEFGTLFNNTENISNMQNQVNNSINENQKINNNILNTGLENNKKVFLGNKKNKSEPKKILDKAKNKDELDEILGTEQNITFKYSDFIKANKKFRKICKNKLQDPNIDDESEGFFWDWSTFDIFPLLDDPEVICDEEFINNIPNIKFMATQMKNLEHKLSTIRDNIIKRNNSSDIELLTKIENIETDMFIHRKFNKQMYIDLMELGIINSNNSQKRIKVLNTNDINIIKIDDIISNNQNNMKELLDCIFNNNNNENIKINKTIKNIFRNPSNGLLKNKTLNILNNINNIISNGNNYQQDTMQKLKVSFEQEKKRLLDGAEFSDNEIPDAYAMDKYLTSGLYKNNVQPNIKKALDNNQRKISQLQQYSNNNTVKNLISFLENDKKNILKYENDTHDQISLIIDKMAMKKVIADMRQEKDSNKISKFCKLMFYSENYNILTINNADDLRLLKNTLENEYIKKFITDTKIESEFQEIIINEKLPIYMQNDNSNLLSSNFEQIRSKQNKLEDFVKSICNDIKIKFLDKIEIMLQNKNNIYSDELIGILKEYKTLIENKLNSKRSQYTTDGIMENIFNNNNKELNDDELDDYENLYMVK